MPIVANRIGINRLTGQVITDWDHCVQSINDILTTLLNSRVMRLDYGAADHSLLDRPGNKQVLAQWYSTIVSALIKWEPGYRVTKFTVDGAGADGHFTLTMDGLFYPRGHLGDYSIVETRYLTISLPRIVA